MSLCKVLFRWALEKTYVEKKNIGAALRNIIEPLSATIEKNSGEKEKEKRKYVPYGKVCFW